MNAHSEARTRAIDAGKKVTEALELCQTLVAPRPVADQAAA